MARRKPRLVITVTTTASSVSSPRSRRSIAHRAMRWSPSTSSPRSSTASTRSASPSKASPTAAPEATTAACRSAGWVEPQPVVDVATVGLGVQHLDRRHRAGAGRSGAMAEPTPLAQSMTTCEPVEPSALERRRSATGTSARCRRRPPAPSADAGRRRAGVRRGRGAGQHPVELGLEVGLDRVGRACSPPAAKNLIPLSPNGLCDAEITAPGTSAVGAHPRDGRRRAPRRGPRRRDAAGGRPRARAASMRGPDTRGSRPITKPDPATPAPSTEPRRGPSADDQLVGRARRPGRARRRCRSAGTSAARGLSAWSTAAPCGPS